ncbi:MAG: hypothetical protein F6K04_27530, partial [Leptolyngbya sp. SIO4C5]|nr:hypothetical protein [Leptolyngbya sp. SIO4C5]
RNGAEIITASEGVAQAGNINISSSRLGIINSANTLFSSTILNSQARTQGNAGNVVLNSNEILLDQGYIFANTLGSGDAGTVIINSDRLTLQANSTRNNAAPFISVASQGTGDGGRIVVNTPTGITELLGTDATNLPSAFVFAAFDAGNPGSLSIDTRQLLIQDGALVSGSALGNQPPGSVTSPGSVTINASERIEVSGSGSTLPSSLVLETSNSTGGGALTLTTQQLAVLNGGNVSAQTIGVSNAGTLQVSADEVRIDGESNGFRSRLFFESQNSGQAGGVSIDANRVVINDRGLISVRGNGAGNAGDIDIAANQVRVTNGGEILASSTNGANPGEITISSDTLTMVSGGNILATANDVSGGRISFNNQSSIILGNANNPNVPDRDFGNNTISAQVTGDADVTGGDISFNNVQKKL